MRRFMILAGVMLFGAAAVAQLPKPQNPLWKPVEDTVYLQEVGSQILTDRPITAVAVLNGVAYAGDSVGLWRVDDGPKLTRVHEEIAGVIRMKTLGDALYVAASGGLWKINAGGAGKLCDLAASDVCVHNGKIVVASGKSLYAIEDGGPLALLEGKGSDLLGVASYSGTLYVHDGKQVGVVEHGEVRYEALADWGSLEGGCTIRDIMALGSRLLVASDEGVDILRGMTWYQVRGEDGLCYEDTTCLAQGFDGDLWIGTMRGAIRNVSEQYHYLGAPRWVPGDKVNAVACSGNAAYVATDKGLGIITYEPFTLAKKAAYYERWMEEWGQKRLGFVHGIFLINGEWVREVSDNDVGYSSHYMASKCFEYAVTGSQPARDQALEMMKCVKWSEEITGIPGFPARSIYAVGEKCLKADHGSGGLPAEWHPTPDGVWEWKGDTSSDETDAHAYETTIFLSLVANDEEKKWATEHLHNVMGHIVDNGFLLRDLDGKPTRWARWDPEYLQTPYGYYARGLNGLEAFNYMTTALHFTGDQKFAEGKQKLIGWDYFQDILQQKLAYSPVMVTHFDDRLAFYSYYPLVQYETDPELKSIWLRSLERSWEIKRLEAVPWFNFIYGAVTGNDCEADRAVAHLREWPLDLRRHTFRNSHRDDLYTPKGYRAYAERVKPLSPRETEPNRWDGDFMRLDGGSGGATCTDVGGWLDAYWMGRYYGMITAPKTDDPELTTVPERGLQLGAKPYDGPPRPKLSFEK